MRVLAITIQGLGTLYHHIPTWGKLLKFYAALALPINLFWNRGQPEAAQVEPLLASPSNHHGLGAVL